MLNALLGLGTALAPVSVAIVIGMGVWWLLPVMVGGILVLIFLVVLTVPLRANFAATAADGASRPIAVGCLRHRLWLYAAAVFLYGILETLNGNWAEPLWHSRHSGRW